MDATAIIQLAVALAAVAAAILGCNKLVGKGPRGTVWLVAACLMTWAAILPIVLRDPDGLPIPREWDLLVVVLRLCTAAAFVIGIIDMLQPRGDSQPHTFAEWALKQPVLWGVVLCADFYALLYHGTIHSPLLWRYTAGHPVEVIEAAFFFVGLAILMVRLCELTGQRRLLPDATLGPVPASGQSAAECGQLLAQLAQLPNRLQKSHVTRRLRAALDFVQRKGSAADLVPHLRHLEEQDALQAHADYATLRIIIWAIPILGFLGTVIGITVAIASLSPEALEQSMSEVTQGLGVAFDTTAEALALTMVLMFTKALVERVENRLFADVDAQVAHELVGRFRDESVVDRDPSVAVVRRMSEQVLEAVETLAARQADVWRSSLDEAHQQWTEMGVATGKAVRDSLSTSIRHNLELHANALNEGTEKLAERLAGSAAQYADRLAVSTAQHAEQISTSAAQHAERLERSGQDTALRLREGLERLAELLVEALQQHGEVLTKSELDLAHQNREHISEVQAALGRTMVEASQRQEHLVTQAEHLLKEMQIALVEATGATVRQQEELVRQGDVLLKVVGATGQIARLETALNQNLSAVRKSHGFEDLVLHLSAAIQLLSARLGPRPVPTAPEPHFAEDQADNKAA